MIGEGNQDMRAEIEAKYRMELNRKLGDVNRFLDTQSLMRDKLDTSRTEIEVHLLSDKRKLEVSGKRSITFLYLINLWEYI